MVSYADYYNGLGGSQRPAVAPESTYIPYDPGKVTQVKPQYTPGYMGMSRPTGGPGMQGGMPSYLNRRWLRSKRAMDSPDYMPEQQPFQMPNRPMYQQPGGGMPGYGSMFQQQAFPQQPSYGYTPLVLR